MGAPVHSGHLTPSRVRKSLVVQAEGQNSGDRRPHAFCEIDWLPDVSMQRTPYNGSRWTSTELSRGAWGGLGGQPAHQYEDASGALIACHGPTSRWERAGPRARLDTARASGDDHRNLGEVHDLALRAEPSSVPEDPPRPCLPTTTKLSVLCLFEQPGCRPIAHIPSSIHC